MNAKGVKVGNWGFRKTFRLGRGARLTVGKKSAGVSVGAGPLRVAVNSKTGVRERVTLPGTGLFYEERSRRRSGRAGRAFAVCLVIAIGAIAALILR